MDWYFDHLNKYTGNKLCNDYYLDVDCANIFIKQRDVKIAVIMNAINLLIDLYNNRINQQTFLAACDKVYALIQHSNP